MGTIKTTNIQTITGSGTLTLGTSGETISVPSGVTFSNSGTATGFGGGKVLQVVTATDETQRTTTSTTFTDITGLSVTITPSSTSSKILVTCSTSGYSGNTVAASEYTLVRGSTNLATNFIGRLFGANDLRASITMTVLDSPATTSATTYKAQFRRSSASGTAAAQTTNSLGTITVMEIGA